MSPTFIFLVGVSLLAVWGVFHETRQWRFKRGIYAREDATPRWRREFPEVQPTVDRVLFIFCDAFMLNSRHRFRLRPDDCIIDIYQNTTGPLADEMQLETLTLDLDKEFHVDLTEFFEERTTLRDVVQAVEFFGVRS